MVYFLVDGGVCPANAPMIHGSGEDDLGFGVPEALQGPDEGIQLHGGVEGHLEEHGVFSRDAVAFQHIGAGGNEGVKLRFLLGGHLQIDEGLNVVAHAHEVHLGAVAFDEPFLLQLQNPGGDGGGGEEDGFRQAF